MEENGIYKGGTLIINLNSIDAVDKDYVYAQGDKVLVALKEYKNSEENILYAEVTPTAGATSVQKIFTAEETEEKLELDKTYILQADLINKNGVFPMLLQNLKVIGRAIIPNTKE